MKAKYFVCRGRTVVHDGISYRPGEVVEVDSAEVAFLKERGFVQDTPPILTPPAELNPGNVGPQGGRIQGPEYRR